MEEIIIYTDGACSNNQDTKKSVGGWAYLLIYKGSKKTNSGKAYQTTNNRMEIKAIIEALKAIKKPTIKTKVHSDSSYVINTVTLGWKKNKNHDLWEELEEQINRFSNIEFIKVKGHDTNEYNNLVDQLAVEMTK
ncbi:Ribonuclease H [Alteracholeplasma palmae J233]|uniref:ribonuclease H n=1 Tax=Alteracholeplasma palmae (strain ATCC 49389 / J233) TaxID=1318466 RepID=U4KKK3_ALTPJ|nr:ribonuclease H [Alteracholeplasma palmae]CCV64128.1 Ribonuclease H [Alteracholeplasma palmae J233]